MILFPNRRGEAGSRGIPWAVTSLIAVSIVLWIFLFLASYPQSLFLRFGFVPSRPRLVSLFTALLLHAGIVHLFGDVYFLGLFGTELARVFRSFRFALFFLACGLGGSALYYAFNGSSTVPYLSASGAVSGIASAYWILFPASEFDVNVEFGLAHLGKFKGQTYVAVLAWFLWQGLVGLIYWKSSQNLIAFSFWGDAGGVCVGVASALILGNWVSEERKRQYAQSESDLGSAPDSPENSSLTVLKL